MEYTFKELKKRQAHADLSILNRDITVCIDRITILVSSDNKYIKPIFRAFYHQITSTYTVHDSPILYQKH